MLKYSLDSHIKGVILRVGGKEGQGVHSCTAMNT